MSSQSRAYSFGPLFGGLSSDQQMRVSDAERQAVTDRLAEHFAEGRLDQAEFDERVARAEAQIGNMVGAENYYQYAEHYFRSMSSDSEGT
jgi:hypothetical protein